MSEGKVKGYYERIEELLGIVAFVITIISGLLFIVTNVYIPNSIAFEMAKYFFLIMIPITVSILAMRIVLRDIGKDIKLFKKYFVKCPNCSNPMFLPILPSMVLWKETHEKDGAPTGRKSKPEYEIACPSCQKTWHIVYRK